MLDLNFDLTTPLLPCERVTRLVVNEEFRQKAQENMHIRTPRLLAHWIPRSFSLPDKHTQHAITGNEPIKPQRDYTVAHLPQVELRILLGRDTLDLNESGVGTGVALRALVTEDTSL